MHAWFLFLLQVFVLNNVYIFGLVHPYIYFFFILILPVNLQKTVVLIIAFILGFLTDIFSNTYGIHTAATVLIAFIRPVILAQFISDVPADTVIEPHLRIMGIRPFLFYVTILTAIHQFSIYLLEIFSLRYFGFTFLKILISLFFSVIFVLLYELLFFLNRVKEQ